MLPVREKVEHVAIRIKFTKTGALQYISHLDLHRTFSRLLVRCGVSIWYSEGFTPHPRLVFATPLSVGAESLCEYVDVFVNGTPETLDLDVLRWQLSKCDVAGLEIKEVCRLHHFKALIHKGCAVNRDLFAHFPGWVGKSLLNGHVFKGCSVVSEERTARGCKDKS